MANNILKSVRIERANSVPVKPKRVPVPGSPTSDGARRGQTNGESNSEAVSNEAETMLAEAQSHVEMMLNQAQMQVTQIREEARQAGWQAGYEEAQNAVQKEFGEALAAIQQLADGAISAKERFLQDSQTEIGQLAVAIGKKIIGQELTVNSKSVMEIVAQAIKRANIMGACRIHVSPADYEILSPYWETIPSLQPSDRSWELVADENISQGGCLIDVDGGTLDARLETQMSQVRRAFDKL